MATLAAEPHEALILDTARADAIVAAARARLRAAPLTADEQRECARLARVHERKHPHPIAAIRVSRETGAIVGIVRRAEPKRATASRPRPAPRARERRAGSSRRTRAPADDGSEPPPVAAAGECPGCHDPFTPSRPNQHHCSAKCRVRAHRANAAVEIADPADALLERYRAEVEKARRAHHLAAEEALDLLLNPSQRVLKLLAAEDVTTPAQRPSQPQRDGLGRDERDGAVSGVAERAKAA